MINVTAIAKNSHHIRRMVDDSLVYPFLNLPLVQSMMISIAKAHELAHTIQTPYLIVHGVKDQITPISDSVKIIHQIGSKNKKLVKFEDGYHELHHDEEQEDMYREIHLWLETVDLQPLGVVNKTKRVEEKRKRYRKWKVLGAVAIIYIFFALRLISRGEFQVAGGLQKILNPILYVAQLIRG